MVQWRNTDTCIQSIKRMTRLLPSVHRYIYVDRLKLFVFCCFVSENFLPKVFENLVDISLWLRVDNYFVKNQIQQ